MKDLFKHKPPLKLRVDDPSSIELRPYNRETDYQGVLDVVASRYPEIGGELDITGPHKNLTEIEKTWREPGGEFMVLTRDSQVIGTLCVKPVEDRRKTAEFDYLFLLPNEEAKGLGLKLLKWGFDWCMQHNIKMVELWTSERRKRTHKLYRKLGFEDNGIRKLYRNGPDRQDVLYFELDLYDEKKMKRLEETAKAIKL